MPVFLETYLEAIYLRLLRAQTHPKFRQSTNRSMNERSLHHSPNETKNNFLVTGTIEKLNSVRDIDRTSPPD